jgi:hypothetical protein
MKTDLQLVPLQLSNIVFCRTEVHYFRGTMPHGIRYHFLGQALVLDIPLQVLVADDVQYHSVAATGRRGKFRHHPIGTTPRPPQESGAGSPL